MFFTLVFLHIKEFFTQQLGIYSYQNIIEILLITFCSYHVLRWLAQDSTKKLVLYVYAYAGIMIASYFFSCSILLNMMIMLAPIAAILCIITHQKQLQKNFVLNQHQHITTQSLPAQNWLDLLIRSCLVKSYQNQSLLCIIQRHDQLHALLQTPAQFHLPIKQEILDLILSSTHLFNPSILLISHTGFMHTVNASWSESFTQNILLAHQFDKNQALSHALAQKTDAVIFCINLETKLATLWYQGTTVSNLTIDHLITSCKKILGSKISHAQGVVHAQKNRSVTTSSPLH